MKSSRLGITATWLCTFALAALANTAYAAPTITLGASPASISAGASSTLSWQVTNGYYCTASGAWSGSKPTSGTQSVAPAATSTFRLTCRGGGTSRTASTTVTVTTATVPAISFGASPTTIDAGGYSTLTWSVNNARWCTGSGAWSGDKGLSGTERVTPTATSTYTLYCRGDSSKSVSNTITVRSGTTAPTASLTASPTSIQSGGSSTLTWNSTNATSCTASGGWSGSVGTSGSQSVSPTATTNYTLTCAGSGGSIARSAQISVSGGSNPVASLYVSPSGSDSAAGTSSAPFKTIQKAANVARAGDVVSVAAGTYVGFQLTTSGTSSSRIVFRANGTVNITQASTGYGIYINNASYVTVEGFSVSGTSSKGIAARGATPTSPMHGVQILSNKITNTREEGLYLSQLESSLVEGNTVTNVGTGGVTETGHGMYLANAGSDNTVVRGNTFSAPSNSWGEAMHINGDESVGGDGLIKNLLIENNRILGGFNNGMSLDGVQSSVIRNNIVVDTNHHGIRGYRIDGAAGPSGLVIVNNTIRAPGGNAVKTTDDSGSSVVFNNILYGGDGSTNFGVSASTGANLSTFAANSDYSPQSAAIGTGLTSLAGKVAPTTDVNGGSRHNPPDIGAVEH